MLVQDWQTKSAKIHLKSGQSLFIVSKSSQGIVFLGIFPSFENLYKFAECLFFFYIAFLLMLVKLWIKPNPRMLKYRNIARPRRRRLDQLHYSDHRSWTTIYLNHLFCSLFWAFYFIIYSPLKVSTYMYLTKKYSIQTLHLYFIVLLTVISFFTIAIMHHDFSVRNHAILFKYTY